MYNSRTQQYEFLKKVTSINTLLEETSGDVLCTGPFAALRLPMVMLDTPSSSYTFGAYIVVIICTIDGEVQVLPPKKVLTGEKTLSVVQSILDDAPKNAYFGSAFFANRNMLAGIIGSGVVYEQVVSDTDLYICVSDIADTILSAEFPYARNGVADVCGNFAYAYTYADFEKAERNIDCGLIRVPLPSADNTMSFRDVASVRWTNGGFVVMNGPYKDQLVVFGDDERAIPIEYMALSKRKVKTRPFAGVDSKAVYAILNSQCSIAPGLPARCKCEKLLDIELALSSNITDVIVRR
ncbi:MAG: hypothetical protein NC218_01350 [Acetobacter sp.]|nr:hypothetical protein [Acetobacter sp.]